MLIDSFEYLRSLNKYKKINGLLADIKFENNDVGPLNEVGSVNKFGISIPKCGTTAVQRGFERIGHQVIHAHNNPTTYEAFVNGNLLKDAGISLETLVRFRRRLSTEPIHFFFGYREPISWYLSLAGHFGMPMTEDLRTDILCRLHNGHPWNKYRLADARKVVERASGLDLFAKSFDKRAGYTVLRNGNIDVILYRFDRLKELESYIKRHIDDRFEMKMERVNSDENYVDFVRKLLPAEILQVLYSDPIFSYFYDQIDAALLLSRYVSS